MKAIHIPLLLFTLVLSACSVEPLIDPANKYDINMGFYPLLEESVGMMPYKGKTRVVFVDSLGNEVEFQIEPDPVTWQLGFKLYNYDFYEPGDTVLYRYMMEHKSIYMHNDSLDFQLEITLHPLPYWPEPQHGYVADHIRIDIALPPNISYPMLKDIINQRTWPEPLYAADRLGAILIHGRTFNNVRISRAYRYQVYYNDDLGIVSFIDHSGRTWRFDRFPE